MSNTRSILNKAWFPLALVLVICAGCSSPGRSTIVSQAIPVEESTRSSFGRVGLLLPESRPGFGFRYPMNTKRAMGHAAEKTWDTISDEEDGFADFLLDGVISGVFGVFGGLATGVPQHEIDAAEKQMWQVLKENSLLHGISNRVQTFIQTQGSPPLIEIPEVIAVELRAVERTNRNYQLLTAIGIDTLIEISLNRHNFQAEERSNPPMKMEAVAEVDITQVWDGAPLFNNRIEYSGHQHRFTEWAAEDARRFRSELKRAGRVIARSIVDQVFFPAHADLK